MKTRLVAFAVLSILAIGLSACSAMSPAGTRGVTTEVIPNTGASSVTTPLPATVPAAAVQGVPNSDASGVREVMLASNSKLGSMLTDAHGRALYMLTKDGTNMPTCYSSCAQLWPPFITSANSIAGNGVDASKLGTTTRTDGSTQVTYNGHPLYYFAQDLKPGYTSGEGYGGVWFVVSPSGEPIH